MTKQKRTLREFTLKYAQLTGTIGLLRGIDRITREQWMRYDDMAFRAFQNRMNEEGL